MISDQVGFDASAWIGTSSLDYMKYVCDISVDDSDNQQGVAKIIENTKYKENKDFIDIEYSISLRNFDTDYAIDLWTFNVGSYKYNIPISISSSSDATLGIVPLLPYTTTSYLMENTVTVRWRLYRRIGDIEKQLVMECYNKIMLIWLSEKGIYDIELTIWDKHGNKYVKNLDGYIKYN
jgi:hypothetical protein